MVSQRPGWSLWIWWILTFSPVLPAVLLAALLVSQQEYGFLISWLVLSIAFACAIVIGILQQVILRRYTQDLRRWVWATCAGAGLLLLTDIILPNVFPLVDYPQMDELWYRLSAWAWGIIWLLTGIAQWFFLRKHVQLAGLWVLATAFGAVTGFYLGSLVGSQFGVRSVVISPNSFAQMIIPAQAWIIGIIVACLTLAVCTATILVWLLQRQFRAGKGMGV